ncbi:MAG: hypothetical protein HC895_25560, partial [Leptolyngbyaceae cyanobacterium SM1_3_5]|nr:hypothetical protein [Leptolyngbyaceae cyanobacterium SM1_3_5]
KPDSPVNLAASQAVMEHLRSITAQASQQAVIAAMSTGQASTGQSSSAT